MNEAVLKTTPTIYIVKTLVIEAKNNLNKSFRYPPVNRKTNIPKKNATRYNIAKKHIPISFFLLSIKIISSKRALSGLLIIL
jgi:hypothetical protein